jgi:hypothetical protein
MLNYLEIFDFLQTMKNLNTNNFIWHYDFYLNFADQYKIIENYIFKVLNHEISSSLLIKLRIN